MVDNVVKLEEKTSLAVSQDTRREIMKVQSELQIEQGGRISINDTITFLIDFWRAQYKKK
jgi:hypothetical protein